MAKLMVIGGLIFALLAMGGCGKRAANMGTAPPGGSVAPPASSDENSRQ
ncbi:MAG: hypothetical protein U1F33_12685 [Alphaproteobacteria bacterium]